MSCSTTRVRSTAVTIEWTFDDGYAQMALDGLDTDGDGVYSATELEALTRENMDSLKDYDYFLHAFADGKPLRIQPAKDPGQIYSNDRLKLYFTVPLETPIDPKKNDFYYRIYDPEFFIAMDYIKDEPVTAQGADAGRLQARPPADRDRCADRGDAADARHQGPRLAAAAG